MSLELIVILFVQWVYKQSKEEDYISCEYTVISKSTGYEYKCIGIRENEDHTLDIKIYNHFTDTYEWYPYYKFNFK
jgi:hypothetical protein